LCCAFFNCPWSFNCRCPFNCRWQNGRCMTSSFRAAYILKSPLWGRAKESYYSVKKDLIRTDADHDQLLQGGLNSQKSSVYRILYTKQKNASPLHWWQISWHLSSDVLCISQCPICVLCPTSPLHWWQISWPLSSDVLCISQCPICVLCPTSPLHWWQISWPLSSNVLSSST
jgi:hypothetical protein